MTDNRKLDGPVKFDFDFDEAMERVAKTDPKEVNAVTAAAVSDETMDGLIAAFERAAHTTADGVEFWTARDLARLLDYADYRNFVRIIDKAKDACRAVNLDPRDHFVEITDMIDIGKGAKRERDNMHLDRYACYLVAQNGDSNKRPVGFAMNYFAIQTRRQELSEQAVPLSEDEKRVFLRNQIKEHNRYLSSAAKEAGVITSQDFAIFHSKGYQGLYGKTVGQIRQYKGLPNSVDILDRMGSTELAANFFRVTQTEEKLRHDQVRGKQKAFDVHYAVGRQVRDAMLKISGIAPEDLKAVDSIKHAERRVKLMPPVTLPVVSAPVSPPAVEAETELKPINLRDDLWKYALLVIVQKPDMEITTSDLIKELPKYIRIPENAVGENASRNDSKFSQIVRNLKSHKSSKTNFIYQGYAESTEKGFRATQLGLEFVKEYFG